MLQIDTLGHILLDGQRTGLALVQRREGTAVFTPESRLAGTKYREHPMPHTRYSAAFDEPLSGVPGAKVLEADVRALLARLAAE